MTAIIIPCYNEAQRLDTGEFQAFIRNNRDIKLIFVDDGSTDNTKELILKIIGKTGNSASFTELEHNMGKAEAVRHGILTGLEQNADYLGYWDADLATPLSLIPNFVRQLDHSQDTMMVFGIRLQRLGAQITRHWYRHYPGRIVATWISQLLSVPVYDTQCGAKLIKRELAREIFAEPFISRWLFDVELVARTIACHGRRKTMEMIYEYPLETWQDMGRSKITPAYLPKIPIELLKIHRRYRKLFKD